MTENKAITATDISNLLIAKKSEKFICIPECKTGKSWGSNYRIMDLWTMAKSWSNPQTIAYEIKISRNDFLHDDKWRNYLDYCSEFYFIASPGIIQKEELPQEAGLIQCSKNCTILYTKKGTEARRSDPGKPVQISLNVEDQHQKRRLSPSGSSGILGRMAQDTAQKSQT